MKHNEPSLQIILFDSSDLKTLQNLQYTADAIKESITQQCRSIIVCGAFAYSHIKLLNLANDSFSISEEEINTQLHVIIQTHISVLDTFLEIHSTKIKSAQKKYYDSTVSQIQYISHCIQLLLRGIHFVKEISVRTSALLNSYTAQLAALLIQANIYFVYDETFLIVDSNEKIQFSNTTRYFILSSLTNQNTQDCIGAQLAIIHNTSTKIDFPTSTINIWTHLAGIMTANPKIILNARPIASIDYHLAQEIAYLGGKILHPTAINMILHHNIPINIYSFYNPNTPASIISPWRSSCELCRCVSITDRDGFTMLSIRSTRMFDTYGYLEKVFRIFNSFLIPVETLTTSEISITITFPTSHFSDAFLTKLSLLGEIEYAHNQSIISLIGHEYWKSPKNVAKTLGAVADTIPLHMVSLGKSGSNLSVVIRSSDKKDILTQLHAHFFE